MNFFTLRVQVLLLVIVLTVIPNYAQSDGDFEILQNANNTITITGYKGSVTDVVIPPVLYGIKVTGIAKNAFWRKGITSVVLPNTLISIAEGAFASYCMGDARDSYHGTDNELGEIVLPNTVTQIERCAFMSSGVTKVSFGNNVRSIGSYAFRDNKIKEVNLPSSLTSIEWKTFQSNEIERVTFGNGIKEIKSEAFMYNKIEELALPPSVKTIGGESFAYNHIQYLTIPMGVTIEGFAFRRNQLQSVTIPNGVTVGSNVFSENPINTLVIPATLKMDIYAFVAMYANKRPFLDLPLTRITMPANKDNDFLKSTGFEESFVNFYINQGRAARTYFKNGPIWTLTAPEPKIEEMFTDSRNGMSYKTVNIGGKTWMAANLSYKSPIGKSGCYDKNPDNCRKYGGLYDWHTAMKVCPEGWHLPSNQEWNDLVTAVGNGAAGKLKAIGGWDKYRNGGDDFGFSALPGGRRDSEGSFGDIGSDGYWWTATVDSEDGSSAYRWKIGYDYDIGERNNDKNNCYSVRCVQD